MLHRLSPERTTWPPTTLEAVDAGAAIGDGLPRIDPIDVTARYTPGGHRLESGPRGDRTHGVAGTNHDATRTCGGRSAGTSAEATVDDLHDRRVIATQRLPAGRIVAEVAADGARAKAFRSTVGAVVG